MNSQELCNILSKTPLRQLSLDASLRAELEGIGFSNLGSVLSSSDKYLANALPSESLEQVFGMKDLVKLAPEELAETLGVDKSSASSAADSQRQVSGSVVGKGTIAASALREAVERLRSKYSSVRPFDRPKTLRALMDENPRFRKELESINAQSDAFKEICDGKTPAKYLKSLGILRAAGGRGDEGSSCDSRGGSSDKSNLARSTAAKAYNGSMTADCCISDGYSQGMSYASTLSARLAEGDFSMIPSDYYNDSVLGNRLPTLGEAYSWFDEVIGLPVDEAGSVFFNELGYLSKSTVLVSSCSGYDLYQKIRPDGVYANEHDRFHMASAEEASFVSNLTWRSGGGIAFFAVDLLETGTGRTDSAYGFHKLIARCVNDYSVVLFRADNSIMLSFQLSSSDGQADIILSDWFSEDDPYYCQFDSMHIAGADLSSPDAVVGFFAHAVARSYYVNPISAYEARYGIVLCYRNENLRTIEDLRGAVDEVLEAPQRFYGCDYMEPKTERLEDFEKAVDFDLLEWKLELEEDESESSGSEPGDASEDEDFDDEYDFTDSIPEDVANNPIRLLEWLKENRPIK